MTQPPADPKQLYPVISGILAKTGASIKMGGMLQADQHFEATEAIEYTWFYGVREPQLRRLYGLGKTAQWKSEDLPWDTQVDLEQELFTPDQAWVTSDWYRKLTAAEKRRMVLEYNTNVISNFLHGEQGALIAASQLISAVPDMDAKFYAATQSMDEARLVEVFARYLDEKLGQRYEVTQNLFNLLQAITVESRWDFKFLGMQLIVEGLALSAFMALARRCKEPLLKQLIRMVLQDESRHVAYGVLSLKDHYADMSEAERRERQEFVYEATLMMRNRLFSGQIFERMGLERAAVSESMRNSTEVKNFTNLLYANVVPNMKKIGLLDGFLAEKFAELDILRFQDVDTDGMIQSFIQEHDAQWTAAGK
ncbi:MAG TPA: ferritin-like domain-containing protein [bacterium]|nr:ferritin-like domain-containing protein [bacterium]